MRWDACVTLLIFALSGCVAPESLDSDGDNSNGNNTNNSVSRFDKDGDGVHASIDCDDRNDAIGELLYANDFSGDAPDLIQTAALPDPWIVSEGLATNVRGGQQALLGTSDFTDTVTFVEVRGNGMERKCNDCAYSVHAAHANSNSANHALWMNGMYGKLTRLRFRDGARYRLDRATGIATLRGTAYIYSVPKALADKLDEEWHVEMDFVYRGTGNGAQGNGGPKRERAKHQGKSVTDKWEYLDMVRGEMTKPDGSRIELIQFPENSKFPLQTGTWANNKNENYGGSMWFTFNQTMANGDTWNGKRGDLNADFRERDRFRAGILARASLDADQDEGYHGYRCAVARNSPIDCHKPGRFVQIASFLDGPEDDINSECDDAVCPPNTTFDQLARAERSVGTDVLRGDNAKLTFWAVGEDLVCQFQGKGNEVVTTRAKDNAFGRGAAGLSVLNLHSEFGTVKVCAANRVPE